MDKKDPHILLIDKTLEKLSAKYNTAFSYEVKKTNIAYSFTIFQEKNPLYHKDLVILENQNTLATLTEEVISDFIIKGIERIFMQKENEKRLFPKQHSNVPDNTPQITKGKW